MTINIFIIKNNLVAGGRLKTNLTRISLADNKLNTSKKTS